MKCFNSFDEMFNAQSGLKSSVAVHNKLVEFSPTKVCVDLNNYPSGMCFVSEEDLPYTVEYVGDGCIRVSVGAPVFLEHDGAKDVPYIADRNTDFDLDLLGYGGKYIGSMRRRASSLVLSVLPKAIDRMLRLYPNIKIVENKLDYVKVDDELYGGDGPYILLSVFDGDPKGFESAVVESLAEKIDEMCIPEIEKELMSFTLEPKQPETTTITV